MIGAVLTGSAALIAVRLALGPDVIGPVAGTMRACFALSLVIGALFLYARWRFLEDAPVGWLSFSLLALGIYLQPQLYLLGDRQGWEGGLSPCDLLLMVALVLAIRAAKADVSPIRGLNPVFLGGACGLTLSGLRLLVDRHGPELSTNALYALVTVGFLATVVICAGAIVRNGWLPRMWRWHFVSPVVVGIGCHHFLTGPHDPLVVPPIFGAVLALGASLQVLGTSAALLQDAHQQQAGHLADLTARVRRAEQTIEHDEELLHEARATVAGLTSASQLLTTSAHQLARAQVGELQAMLQAETERLQALLSEKEADQGADGWFTLDDILQPLVVSTRTQGVGVDFHPTGLRVWGDRESVTVAVHVLLCNARRHAPGARIRLWAARHGNSVVLHVADDGPGLPPELCPTLFNRGARGQSSPGQGLGLYSARKQLRAHGGDLELVPSSHGARFAVTLPLAAACNG